MITEAIFERIFKEIAKRIPKGIVKGTLTEFQNPLPEKNHKKWRKNCLKFPKELAIVKFIAEFISNDIFQRNFQRDYSISSVIAKKMFQRSPLEIAVKIFKAITEES